MTHTELKQSSAALRGGIPERCDFCKSVTKPDDMHPEEAGMWICITCINADPEGYYGKNPTSEVYLKKLIE